MVFAIKAEVVDPRAKTFTFTAHTSPSVERRMRSSHWDAAADVVPSAVAARRQRPEP
jgi:hypothetical protein